MLISFMCYFNVNADSYLSDKTEISVDLEVSGAEALCQTDDGYVWIAQYSGLTRYDSREYVTYKEFTENDKKYDIINVRDIVAKGNSVYMITPTSLYKYEDNKFYKILSEYSGFVDVEIDSVNDKVFIASQTSGIIIYDIKTEIVTTLEESEKDLGDISIDLKRNKYYYTSSNGLYSNENEQICSYENILDTHIYDDILYIGRADGTLNLYDLKTNTLLEKKYDIGDQINKVLASPKENLLFVACEKEGVCCINLIDDSMSFASNLENKSQLVDLMIDYEGNLWIASHYIGASGVSIITKNSLLDLLYDDLVWQSLSLPPDNDRNVYALDRYDDILYICATSGLYFYDKKEKKILDTNPVMEKVKEYATLNNIAYFDFRDVEEYNGKIYFASYYIGLIEYNPINDEIKIYDISYIESHNNGNLYNNPNLSLTNMIRCLRKVDDCLVMGYSKGIMSFDGENFVINCTNSNVLFINEGPNGNIIFDTTKALYETNIDLKEFKEIPTEKEVSGNRLKFLVDGDYIYYNLNSRLFRAKKVNDEYVQEEIVIPYIKGSIVELSKIRFQDRYGNINYKYVIGSQTQIYISDSLSGERLENYEFYDSTNGLQPIIANTSGYFDSLEQKYYFQSTTGIFVYNFNDEMQSTMPIKMAVNSIDIDGTHYYGNDLKIDKNTSRIAFNLSILGFRPNKGFTIYYKLDGVDNEYKVAKEESLSISYTNLAGGKYSFHVYVVDEYGQVSNKVDINLVKNKFVYEEAWFWIITSILTLGVLFCLNFFFIKSRIKASEKRQQEYRNITMESIQAIARTIDAKDEYTNGHSLRVGYYSKVIAENLHMSHDEVDNIYYVALLHDIGKIAIPDSILNKPGRLTDDEFNVMKSHTTSGSKILNGISTLPHIVEGAKSHHERWDGFGYPQKLKGEEIPFVARIICCADCFDAMASKRVYKDAFDLEKIISEFEKCAGSQFDPKIAALVVELIKAGKLKPYSGENTYLASDGKTYRIKKDNNQNKTI